MDDYEVEILDVVNRYQPVGYSEPPYPDLGDKNTPFEIDVTPLFSTRGIIPDEQFAMNLLARVQSDNSAIVSRWHETYDVPVKDDDGSDKVDDSGDLIMETRFRYIVLATPLCPVSSNAFTIRVQANHRQGQTKPIRYTGSYITPERGKRSDLFTLHLESGIDGTAVNLQTSYCQITSKHRDKVKFALVHDFEMDFQNDPSQLLTQHPFNRGLVCVPFNVAYQTGRDYLCSLRLDFTDNFTIPPNAVAPVAISDKYRVAWDPERTTHGTSQDDIKAKITAVTDINGNAIVDKSGKPVVAIPIESNSRLSRDRKIEAFRDAKRPAEPKSWHP